MLNKNILITGGAGYIGSKIKLFVLKSNNIFVIEILVEVKKVD